MTTETPLTLAEIADRLRVTKALVRHAVRWAGTPPAERSHLRTFDGEKSMPVRLFRPAEVAAAVEEYRRTRRRGGGGGVRVPPVPVGHEGRIRLYAAKVAAGERLFEPGLAPPVPHRRGEDSLC